MWRIVYQAAELGRLRSLIALDLRMPEGRENRAPIIGGTERGTRRGRTRDRLSLIFDDQFCVGFRGHSFFDGVAAPGIESCGVGGYDFS